MKPLQVSPCIIKQNILFNISKVEKNDLNANFYKNEFQELWKRINHKCAYAVFFDISELINKAIRHIDSELFVSELTYTVSKGEQTDEMDIMPWSVVKRLRRRKHALRP